MSDDKPQAAHMLGAPYKGVKLDSANNIRIHLKMGYTGNMDPSTRVVLDAMLALIEGQAQVIDDLEDRIDVLEF